MDKYIGMDVHATSTTMVVVSPTGRRLGKYVVETNGHALVEQLLALSGRRHVCLEEGTQSAWLYEVLSPHAHEVVVVAPTKSAGQKNDEADAYRLAEQLRAGTIERRVFKEQGEFKRLRELSRTHRMLVEDVVRVKNRLKSMYRSRGVPCPGETAYTEKGRETLLESLPVATREAAELLYTQYDGTEEVRRRAEKDLIKEAKRHSAYRILCTCPGLGPIRVAQMLSVVISPNRFRTKRQFWSYCGLSIVMRSSSDWVRRGEGSWQRVEVNKTRGLTRSHNRTLKSVFKGAAMTVIQHGEEIPLKKDYQRCLKAGTKPPMAALTLARKIAAIALSMWKSNKEYDAKMQ